MFTGIIKQLGEVVDISTQGNNKIFTIQSDLAQDVTIDQSVSHNGICLTVETTKGSSHYAVTAIHETLQLTTAHEWKIGSKLNLETAARMDSLLDGHIVQGHVDAVGQITDIVNEKGSYRVTISFDQKHAPLVISKGSICIDGVSLTVIQPTMDSFQVAIIPYTWDHTIFHTYQKGTKVNLEFDIIGKYILRNQELSK